MKESVIGVLADTHIPDRSRQLNPQIKEIFADAKVGMILHAGDISRPRVLRELESIAPVHAVRGNRDLLWRPQLPLSLVIEVGGKKIGMTHGHGSFVQYAKDKFNFMLRRYKGFDFFAERAIEMLPKGMDAIVFGHSHSPMERRKGGMLIINPGSACCHLYRDKPPSIGLLRVSAEGIQSQIIAL